MSDILFEKGRRFTDPDDDETYYVLDNDVHVDGAMTDYNATLHTPRKDLQHVPDIRDGDMIPGWMLRQIAAAGGQWWPDH